MRVRRVCFAVFCGFSVWISSTVSLCALTETATPLRYRGGIHNAFDQHALKPKQLQTLLKSLRKHTGWQQLNFDENGFLICSDETQFVGGSATARALLSAAFDAPMAFDLESHHHTAQVSFARLAVPAHFRSMASGLQIDAFPLQLDFADFSKLRGEPEVLAAFDVGLVLMHELAHGVLGLRDAHDNADVLGDCERYINQIRRELGLPERQRYRARTQQFGVSMGGGITHYAELVFTHRQGDKLKHYYLQWEAERVGRAL